MKKIKRCLSMLIVLIMVLGIAPISVKAKYYYDDTNEANNTVNETFFNMSGNYTYTNNGTVKVSSDFTLMSGASFVNNNIFDMSGSYAFATISSGTSFINSGTATFSGCMMLEFSGTVTNTGIMYFKDIDNFTPDGFVNEGVVICQSGVSETIVNALKNCTIGAGRVETQGTGNSSVKTPYNITYNLNGGEWTVSNTDFLSYYHDTAQDKFYKIGFDEPFDKLNDAVAKEHYVLEGWTCDKSSDTTPSKYMDILTSWKSNITLTAHWKPVDYNISYFLVGGTFDESVTNIYKDGNIMKYNIESDDFTLPTPEKPGYDFEGWILGGTNQVYPSVTISKGTAGNISYTAKWKARGNTPYKVNVYYMDDAGKYSAVPDLIYNETGKTNDIISIPSYTYDKEGFSFDDTKSTITGTIDANGTLELSFYYARKSYDIEFKSYDGSQTLYSYKAYYGTDILFGGNTPAITDEDYTYNFVGWSNKAESDYSLRTLGKVYGSKTFYAAFEKEANFCYVTFESTEGFTALQDTTYKIKKGESFNLNLYLKDNYYVGTNDWILTFSQLSVKDNSNKGLKLGTDFDYSFAGYGEPVVLSIPNVTKDLTIIFDAVYHDKHDFLVDKDVVLKEATCNSEGLALHYCYMCGKMVAENTPVNLDNHTNLVKCEVKAATRDKEGNIEYWYCEDCNRYFSDKDGKNEITKEQTITPKLNSDTSNVIPQTGDESHISICLIMMLISGCIILVVTLRKRNN